MNRDLVFGFIDSEQRRWSARRPRGSTTSAREFAALVDSMTVGLLMFVESPADAERLARVLGAFAAPPAGRRE